MKEQTLDWIRKASEDMRAANLLITSYLYDACCYHSQQAAEKYLKAILCELNQEIPKTHDLEKIANLIKNFQINFIDEIMDDCMKLSGIDTLVRYPGYNATEDDALSAVASCNQIKSFTLNYFGLLS